MPLRYAALQVVRTVAIQARSNLGTSPGPTGGVFGGRSTLDYLTQALLSANVVYGREPETGAD